MTPVHRPGVLVAAHLAGAHLILTTPSPTSIPPPLFLLSTKHRVGYKRIACLRHTERTVWPGSPTNNELRDSPGLTSTDYRTLCAIQ